MKTPDDTAPQNIQNVADGASATQINHPQAPVLVGGEGNTYNFNYGIPAQPQRTPSAVPYNVPHRGTLHFVGRDEDLETLHQQLQTASTIAISAIAGMGGIGKTELALQYALKHLELEDYPGGVCWLRAREDVGLQIVAFARSHLDLSVPEDLELGQQVAWCWQHWPEKTTLIVLDDVQKLEAVQAFLPPVRSHFKVLLTSRSRFGSPVQNYEIKVLSEAAALELLRKLVPDGRIDQDLATAKQVCEWLGYLPLGLELVGRYLARKSGTSIGTLWQRLQDKKLAAKALLEAESGMTASLGVTAAFELSWQELDEKAQAIAAVLSLFALAEIPWSLVQACLPEMDEEDLEDLRDEQLVNLSLLSFEGEGVYQLHQLLREFFAVKRSWMAADEGIKTAFCRVMVVAAEKIPYVPTLSTIERMSIAIPHIEAAATTLESWLADSDVIEPFRRIGWFYQGQGAYVKALDCLKNCSAMVERRLGNNHPDLAYALDSLALIYEFLGDYSEAEALFLKALGIWKQQSEVDLDLPGVISCMSNLAGLYSSQGKYAEAEQLYLQSLDLDSQFYGNSHPEIAKDFNNLAELFRLQTRYIEAEQLLIESLKIQQGQWSENPMLLVTTLNNLSILLLNQGRIEEAEAHKLESIEIEKKHLAPDHPQVAISIENLAEIYRAQGRGAEAEPLYIESLEILQNHLGGYHLKVAAVLNNLSLLYLDQERYQEAESLKLRSLEIEEAILGTQYPQIASSLNNLALIYQSQKRYFEAEETYKRAVELGQQQLGVDHPDIALSLSNLAGLYTLLGRYTEAEPLLIDAFSVYSSQLGDEHPTTQASWQDFVIFLWQAVEHDRTIELSDHPMTKLILKQLRKKKPKHQARGFGKKL
jgi:tetratricopeptide (TPR) repeat protein